MQNLASSLGPNPLNPSPWTQVHQGHIVLYHQLVPGPEYYAATTDVDIDRILGTTKYETPVLKQSRVWKLYLYVVQSVGFRTSGSNVNTDTLQSICD